MICIPLPQRAPARRRGFTLVEMMTVVVIMGLMAAMAGPRMARWLQTLGSTGVTNEVVGDLMLARTQAVREGRTVSFRVVSSSEYTVTLDNPDGTVLRVVKRMNLSNMHRGTTISPAGRIAFDSRGMLRTASTIGTLTVTRGHASDVITVTGVGRIKRE